MMRRIGIKYALLCLCCTACVRRVAVPIRHVPGTLVVQGMVTTAAEAYTINLSHSGPYTNTVQAIQQDSTFYIADATVVIKDDLGDSTNCSYAGLGNYVSDDPQFVGVIGRTYTLEVYLSDGQKYLSKPETIQSVPPIDSLSFAYDSAGTTYISPPPLIVTVNTHDPGNGRRYYRWYASGYIPRKSWGSQCAFTDPPCTNPYICTCDAFCEQPNTAYSESKVYSNELSGGKEIIKQVYYSPVYWSGNHYFEIDQYSLSLQSYQFWEQYFAQAERTGSILDPLPSPVVGNIYSASDTNRIALGVFSASDVVRKKVVLVPFFLLQYELESVAGQYILPGNCEDVYPGALPDETPPAGWDSAQVVDIR